jgi:putative heme-binding domain-containing protein
MPGGNYGYHPRGPGQSHWHEEQPGVVPKILRTGFGSPTGMCVYEGTLLPKKYWGQLLHTDAGPREVRCYHLKPKGAGYEVEPEVLVSSSDTWFRPSDVCVAPDGSVFIADWYDPGVGGHGVADFTRGRIYRLAPKGKKASVPKVDLNEREGLLTALTSPALSVRHMAVEKIKGLWQKENKALEAYRRIYDAISQQGHWLLVARASWLLSQHPNFEDAVGIDSLKAAARKPEDPRDLLFAQLMITILKNHFQHLQRMPKDFQAGLKDYARSSSTSRREFLLSLRDDAPDSVKDWIIEFAKDYDGKDRFYLAALGIAVGHHDKTRRDILLADFEKHFPEWNDKVADLVWELRPPSVLASLDKRLIDPKLTAAQRARIVDILAASEETGAGKALLNVLQKDVPPEVRDRVIDNLQRFLPGKWQALRSSPELAQTIDRLLKSGDSRKGALTLIAAAERTGAVREVADLATDERQPLALRREAVRTLGQLPAPEAVAALERFLAKPGPLGRDAVVALGTQVPMYREQAGTKAALKALQAVLLAQGSDTELKQTALEALSANRAGTTWLLAAHAQKKLPAALVADAGRLLRNSPFEDLRSRALQDFPPPARINPSKLPSLAVLVTRKGEPLRGKQLLAASAKNEMQCLKCHTILGAGGQIGPDLSAIGTKASRENLLESILFPSKAIADQYLTWVIATKDGLVLTGLLVEETPEHVTIRDANGKDTKIPKKDIEGRTKDPKSLMPDNLIATLTEDDLLDLVEYLMTLKQEDKASPKK